MLKIVYILKHRGSSSCFLKKVVEIKMPCDFHRLMFVDLKNTRFIMMALRQPRLIQRLVRLPYRRQSRAPRTQLLVSRIPSELALHWLQLSTCKFEFFHTHNKYFVGETDAFCDVIVHEDKTVWRVKTHLRTFVMCDKRCYSHHTPLRHTDTQTHVEEIAKFLKTYP